MVISDIGDILIGIGF